MPFDSSLMLKGEYNDALVDIDENDTVSTSLTRNDDGNVVLDIRKSGQARALTAVLILLQEADADAYDDEGTVLIEESDFLDRSWQEVCRFPIFHSHIRKVFITATTAFVAGDVTAQLTETGSNDTGQILYVSEGLLTTGANGGYVLVEMDAAGDLFDEAIGQTETSNGTGVGAKAKATESGLELQMQPGVHVRQFITNKRYIRGNFETVADNMGTGYLLISDAYKSMNSDLGG